MEEKRARGSRKQGGASAPCRGVGALPTWKPGAGTGTLGPDASRQEMGGGQPGVERQV